MLILQQNYSNNLDEKLEKRFKNTFALSYNDINRFYLLLKKGVYPYEYINDSEKFNETTLLGKEEFYNNLNMQDITDVDYMQAKRVCNDFEIKHLGEYHDLYLKSDTLLLVDVFKNSRKICLKMYILEPVKFPSTPGLAWQAALRKNLNYLNY